MKNILERKFHIGQTTVQAQDQTNNQNKSCGQDKYNSSTPDIADLKKNITKYTDYLNEQKDMARKNFKCTKMDYDPKTGRVIYMEFTET